MGKISDVYCKKCKKYPFACMDCRTYESFDGCYISNVPSMFEPKNTTKIPYEKIFNEKIYNRHIGFDPIIVNIKKIIFSGPATIVLWQDGGKTIVKYHKEKGCTYRKDLGILYCIIKHYLCYDNAKLFHKLLKTIDGFCEAENGDKTT